MCEDLQIPHDLKRALERVSFDPVTLNLNVTVDVLKALEGDARYVLDSFLDGTRLDLWKFLREGWSSNATARERYETVGAQARLELHLAISAYHHEATHKVDLLISPLGASWLSLLMDEYALFELYTPLVLNDAARPDGLEIYRHIKEGSVPEALRSDQSSDPGLWAAVERQVLRSLAWGDMRYRKPPGEVKLGWQGLGRGLPLKLFGEKTHYKLIEIGGIASICTFADPNKHVRPVAILEAKAIAAAMLWVLNVSPDPRVDINAYWQLYYAPRRDGAPHDYYLVLDVVAGYYGHDSFDSFVREVCATFSDQEAEIKLRELLLIVTGVCWYALHTPPMRDPREFFLWGLSPAARLVAGLHEALPVILRLYEAGAFALSQVNELSGPEKSIGVHGYSAVNLAEEIDSSDTAHQLQQHSLEEAMARSRLILDYACNYDGVKDPDVRTWFRSIAKLMRPHFNRETYTSRIGMPDDGNPWKALRTDADADLLYDTPRPQGRMAEWLRLRRDLLFFNTLHESFDDPFVREVSALFDVRRPG